MSLLERFSRGWGSRPPGAGGIAREGTLNFTQRAPGWPAVAAWTRRGRCDWSRGHPVGGLRPVLAGP